MKQSLLLLLLPLCLAACKAPAPPKPAAPAPPVDQAALDARFEKTDIKITMEEFDKIRPGMSVEEVVEIIGSSETSKRSHYTPGSAESFTRPVLAMIHRWENPDASWCELEFIDKRLETKRHQDLLPVQGYANSKYTLPEARRVFAKPIKLSN